MLRHSEIGSQSGASIGFTMIETGVVGSPVGLDVGAAVGLPVGLVVGAAVGSPVGLIVGDAVGLLVGLIVGDAVGLLVGLVVGDAVGLLVGSDVGAAVGSPVGLDVGAAVGSLVGLVVGAVVGSPVGLVVGDAVGSLVGLVVGAAVGGIFTQTALLSPRQASGHEATHLLPCRYVSVVMHLLHFAEYVPYDSSVLLGFGTGPTSHPVGSVSPSKTHSICFPRMYAASSAAALLVATA